MYVYIYAVSVHICVLRTPYKYMSMYNYVVKTCGWQMQGLQCKKHKNTTLGCAIILSLCGVHLYIM